MGDLLTQKSTIGKALSIIGLVIMIIGATLAFFSIIGAMTSSHAEWMLLALTSLASGAVSGCIFLGFAEVIKLLNNISHSLGNDNESGLSSPLPRL